MNKYITVRHLAMSVAGILYPSRVQRVAPLAAVLAIAGLSANAAWARDVAVPAPEAAPAAAAEPQDQARSLDTISVIGTGQTRASASITREEIEAVVPGAAPNAILATLPGVNVQTTDPFSMYEFTDSIRIRGFSGNQLGVTLDGVPIDVSDVRAGGPIARYVSTENLGGADVSSGSGDVTQPAEHALGGAIRYFTTAPKGEWGGKATVTMGSNDLVRTFARVDTPEWWQGGPVAYVSLARTRSGVWDLPPATQQRDQVEAKIVQAFEAGSLSLGWIWTDREDFDIGGYSNTGEYDGWPFEQLSNDPAADSNHYSVWKNARRDSLLNLSGDFALSDSVGLKFTAYNENKNGWGIGATSPSGVISQYNNSIDASLGTPGRTDSAVLLADAVFDADGKLVSVGQMARRLEDMGGDRRGLTFGLSWDVGVNKLEVGGWYQDFSFFQVRPLYNIDGQGNFLLDQPYIVNYYDRHFDIKTKQFYIQDTIKLLEDRLTLQVGAKALDVDQDFNGIANLTDYNRNTTRSISRSDSDSFQPQAGVSYKFTDAVEGFVNYAENFSPLPRLALMAAAGTWETTKPESSKNIDLGVRADYGVWSGYVALYQVKYDDRIISYSYSLDPQVVDSTVYQNASAVKTSGLEVTGMWRPSSNLHVGASLSLNNSEFEGSYTDIAGTVIDIDGNDVPDQPKVQFSVNGGWENANGFFATWDAKYTGKREGSVENASGVYADKTFIVNGGLGYQNADFLNGGRLQLSIYNLLDDDDAIGTIFPGQSSASWQLVPPRAYYLSLSWDF